MSAVTAMEIIVAAHSLQLCCYRSSPRSDLCLCGNFPLAVIVEGVSNCFGFVESSNSRSRLVISAPSSLCRWVERRRALIVENSSRRNIGGYPSCLLPVSLYGYSSCWLLRRVPVETIGTTPY